MQETSKNYNDKKRNTSKTTRKIGNNVVIMSTNVSNIHKLSCIKLLTNSDLEPIVNDCDHLRCFIISNDETHDI